MTNPTTDSTTDMTTYQASMPTHAGVCSLRHGRIEPPPEYAHILPAEVDHDTLTARLHGYGYALVKVADADEMHPLQEAFDDLAKALRPDLPGAAHCARGIGGITKHFGAASTRASMEARLGDVGLRAKEVFSTLFGTDRLVVSMDAPTLLPETDVHACGKARAPAPVDSAQTEYRKRVGSKLPLHVDISQAGEAMESSMQKLVAHGQLKFGYAVQGQLVVHGVPKNGSTIVLVPGKYTRASYVNEVGCKFESSTRDFRVCKQRAYDEFVVSAVALEPPAGTLLLWLSRTPHGNKIADNGVTEKRAGQFVCWMPACLEDEATRAATKLHKYDAVCAGRSTDHWPVQSPLEKRKLSLTGGNHYSNGQKKTKVLVSKESPGGAQLWGDALNAACYDAC